jgi:hypothetical protein
MKRAIKASAVSSFVLEPVKIRERIKSYFYSWFIIRFSLGRALIFHRQWMFFFFSLKRKMNQKEKSQPGSVAINVLWLGKGSGCRNITNAALEEVIKGL